MGLRLFSYLSRSPFTRVPEVNSEKKLLQFLSCLQVGRAPTSSQTSVVPEGPLVLNVGFFKGRAYLLANNICCGAFSAELPPKDESHSSLPPPLPVPQLVGQHSLAVFVVPCRSREGVSSATPHNK